MDNSDGFVQAKRSIRALSRRKIKISRKASDEKSWRNKNQTIGGNVEVEVELEDGVDLGLKLLSVTCIF